MTQKIGIYGGTFDPLHFGHLNLAINLMDKHQLDEVWFIPAHINPHKSAYPPISIEHRLAMLNLVIPHIPKFRVVDIEAKRHPPSYTIDTIRTILKLEADNSQDRNFSLLLGEDSLRNFFDWHHVEEIVSLIPLLIGSRSDSHIDLKCYESHPKILEAIHKGLTKTGFFDISATEIRLRLEKGLYCGHLVPLKILDYINKNRIYSSL